MWSFRPLTFEDALRKYDFLATYEQELETVKGIIDFYRMQGIEADYREVRVNPSCLIATQRFVEKSEYKIVRRLVDKGLYKTPVVEEFHPEITHRRYVLDGHNRSKRSALNGVDQIDAFEIYFPNGDVETGYIRSANYLGNMGVMNMPIGSR